MSKTPSKPWFRPKAIGYGSGLPIAWQGWVVLIVYFMITIGAVTGLPFIFPNPAIFLALGFVIVTMASVLLGIICANKTEGGWRWRGHEDT